MVLLPLGEIKVINKMRERIGDKRNIENLWSVIADTMPIGNPAIKVTMAAINPSFIENSLQCNNEMTKEAHARAPTQLSRSPIKNTVAPSEDNIRSVAATPFIKLIT